MYKKIILILLFISLILFLNNRKTILPVSLEITDNFNDEHQKIYLLFEDNKLNTNNLIEYFDNEKIKIISIIPYINPIIEDKITTKIIYHFDHNNIENNLNKFTRYFNNEINKYPHLINQDYIINGIIINKVIIYSSINDLSSLLLKKNKIKYSINNDGPYKIIK